MSDNKLIRIDGIIKNKSQFIEKYDYSYFMKDGVRMSEIITIHFYDGRIREYKKDNSIDAVPMLDLFTDMGNSESVGKFFHANINGKLEYRKIK